MPRASMREQLVDAAHDHFHEHGFNGSGIKDITDAAGVPKGSFYNHFDSKESMAVEVMRRYGESRRLEMLADESVTPVERIRNHFAYLAEDLGRYDYTRGCMFGNFGAELSTQSRTIRAEVSGSFAAWESALAAALGQAQVAGQLASTVDSAVLAGFLVNAWEGAAMRAKVVGGSSPLDDFFTMFDSMTA